MAAADVLAFIAPEFTPLDPAVVAQALAMAEGYRPSCLNQAMGDEAVALYAAWLMSVRGGQPGTQPGGGTLGPLLAEREGDLSRTYAGPGQSSLTEVQLGNYKARYDALARLCGRGSIMTRIGPLTQPAPLVPPEGPDDPPVVDPPP